MAHFTTWNGSAQRTAFGQRSRHHGGDPVRAVGGHVGDLGAALARPGRRRTPPGWPCPGPARPTPAGRCRGRPRPSGTCGRACRRSHRSRSGVSPANRSCSLSTSAQTRVMIAPTVRHAIRISSVTAVFEHCVASQATCSSNTIGVPRAVPGPRHRRHRRARARGSSPAARRPPDRPGSCPGPEPATAAGPRHGRTTVTAAGTDHTGPRPPRRPDLRDQDLLRPRRTRCPRRPSSRPPTAHAIEWRSARRSPLFSS